MDRRILIAIFGLILVVAASLGTFPLTGNAVKDNAGSSMCSNDSIFIELSYNGNFSVINKSLEKGCVPNYLHNAGERYSYTLDSKNQTLYKAEFNPSVIYSDADLNGTIDGGISNASGNIILASPSLDDGENISIYDNNTRVLSVNIYDVGARICRVE